MRSGIKTQTSNLNKLLFFINKNGIVICIWQVFKTLVEVTKDIKGAKVENHKFCTSVHYRNVDEKVRAFLVFILYMYFYFYTEVNDTFLFFCFYLELAYSCTMCS